MEASRAPTYENGSVKTKTNPVYALLMGLQGAGLGGLLVFAWQFSGETAVTKTITQANTTAISSLAASVKEISASVNELRIVAAEGAIERKEVIKRLDALQKGSP